MLEIPAFRSASAGMTFFNSLNSKIIIPLCVFSVIMDVSSVYFKPHPDPPQGEGFK